MRTISVGSAVVLVLAGAAAASAAFAQTPVVPADVKEKLSGSQFSTVTPDGRQEKWVNAADGTVAATLSGTQSSEAGKSDAATGHWSVADDGKYCLHVDWGVQQGGPERWPATG
jgi:hypothetical protein